MEAKNPLHFPEGKWGRSPSIEVTDIKCQICEDKTVGVKFDTSGEEYTAGEICFKCLNKLKKFT